MLNILFIKGYFLNTKFKFINIKESGLNLNINK